MFAFPELKYVKKISISGILIFMIFNFCYYYYQFEWCNGSAAVNKQVKTTRVLIFSYFRSGSTFFSQLLSQLPGTFLHYEPIYLLSGDHVTRNAEEEKRGLSLLRHALRCDFHSVLNLASVNNTFWLRQYPIFNPNATWPPGANFWPPNNKTVTAIEEVCEQHPVQVAKIVRLPLESVAGPLLEEFADFKVIFLVRDPRPVYHSRKGFDWCQPYSSCIDPREFCAAMERDLEYLPVLKDKFPGRVLALRYEDLVVDLKSRTGEVFDFLNWDYAAHKVGLEKWLRVHSRTTNTTVDRDPYSIVKSHSESKAYEWKTRMTEAEVRDVEAFCGHVINTLSSGNFSW